MSIVYLCPKELKQNAAWLSLSEDKNINNQNKRNEDSKVVVKLRRIFIFNTDAIFKVTLYRIYHQPA